MSTNPYESPTPLPHESLASSANETESKVGCGAAFSSVVLGALLNFLLAAVWAGLGLMIQTGNLSPGMDSITAAAVLVQVLSVPSGMLIGPAVMLTVLRDRRRVGFLNLAAAFQLFFLFVSLLPSVYSKWETSTLISACFFMVEAMTLYVAVAWLMTHRSRKGWSEQLAESSRSNETWREA